MKYKIMFNYGVEGYKFHEKDEGEIAEFDSVGEAIDFAMELGYSSPFIIVQVVDWKNLKLS